MLSGDIVKLCFGENYVLPFNIPCIIGINFYMVGMQNAVWTYKNTMGLFRQGRYLLIVTAILNLVFSILLGSEWGLFGILLATSISRLLTNTWYDPYVVFKYGLNTSPKIYLKKYIYFLILLIITIIVSLYLCSFIEFNTILDIINKFIICIIIPNLIFLLAFYKKDEFKYFLELLNKFKMLILHYIKLIKKY